jgi:heme O synthase-like polyprenyltransferase
LLYTVGSVVLAAVFALLTCRVATRRTGDAADEAAKHLFGFSILQLLLLFVFLLAEHGFGMRLPGIGG